MYVFIERLHKDGLSGDCRELRKHACRLLPADFWVIKGRKETIFLEAPHTPFNVKLDIFDGAVLLPWLASPSS